MTAAIANPIGKSDMETGESKDDIARCRVLIQAALDYRSCRLLMESESAFRLALAIQPDDLEAQLGLATVLFRQTGIQNQVENAAKKNKVEKSVDHEADQWVRSALVGISEAPTPALQDSLLLAVVDLVEQLRRYGRSVQADTVIEHIIALEPENEVMHRQFGMLLLRCGEFKYGWRERDKRVEGLSQPAWRGESLAGKTILVQALHGFGDTLQFVRLLPLLKARGARVILEHQPELETLLQGAEGWDALLARHTTGEALAWEFDVHIPLMSLPDPLGIEDNIPAKVPYLQPDTARVRAWQARLGAEQKLRVGLVWAGNPEFKGDRDRSCRLTDYAWLVQCPHVQFYSLQKGQAGRQCASPPARKMRIIDLEPDLHDWADTASAILSLDLVITVDTAVAHLAGALGRPVWVLLPRHACWRWLEERDDSPWYPTMRLFRQSRQGDWSDVLQTLIHALHNLSAARQ